MRFGEGKMALESTMLYGNRTAGGILAPLPEPSIQPVSLPRATSPSAFSKVGEAGAFARPGNGTSKSTDSSSLFRNSDALETTSVLAIIAIRILRTISTIAVSKVSTVAPTFLHGFDLLESLEYSTASVAPS